MTKCFNGKYYYTMDINENLQLRINKLTCQFEDKDLESEYQDFRWEKMRNYVRNLLIIAEVFNMLIRLDDIRLLGPIPIYIGFHLLGFAVWAYFLFFLSSFSCLKKQFLLFIIVGTF